MTMSTTMPIHDAKDTLRKEMLARRRALEGEDTARASSSAHAHLREVPWYADARIVALYAPMAEHNELATAAIAAELTARGAMVVYPRVVGRGKPLRFHIATEAQLVALKMGLRQPAETAPEVPLGSIDLVIVPGLAFDETGHRLGFGAGYYDLTLDRAPRAHRVGFAHELQMVASVPSTKTDVRMDAIVTEQRARILDGARTQTPRSRR
jgi:5-formyltetrahydrofolate cyclo-ligase